MVLLGAHILHAQNAITTTGGNGSGSSGNISFTVGQTTLNQATSASRTLAEGVQQPYEISIVTQLSEATDITLTITAFPNVTTNKLTLKIENQTLTQNLSYQLIDMNGLLLESKNNIGSETLISLDNLVAATYFLKVNQDSKEIKLFRIIKK